MPGKPSFATVAVLCVAASSAVFADSRGYIGPDGYPAEGKEYRQEFRSGPCRVKREQEDDGYKEERKCYGPPGYERKEKFRNGPCKIEREWKRDGEYKEKTECK